MTNPSTVSVIMMPEIAVCLGCLATNTPLYNHSIYQEIYESLTNLSLSVPRGKPQYFCHECSSRLLGCQHFRDKCLRANRILTELIENDLVVNQQSISMIDRQTFNLKSSLITTPIELIDIPPELEEMDTKKTSNNIEIKNLKQEIFDELENYKEELKIENCSNDSDIFEDVGNCDTDSDEDVPLKSLSIRENNRTKPSECLQRVRKKKKSVDKVEKKKVKDYIEKYAKVIFLTKEQQISEMNERANSDNYQEASFKCSICYRGFVEEMAFNNHMMKHDQRSGDYECEICRMRYETAKQLRSHSMSSHYRRFECRKCQHSSLTAHQARNHERWHSGFKYECKICGDTFKKPTSHLTHLRKVHPTEFACPSCGDSFVSRHGLLMHKSKNAASHKNIVEKESEPAALRFCSDCNVQFVTMDAWKKHILTSYKHVTDTRSGTHCRICDTSMSTNAELLDHVRQHARDLKHPVSATKPNLDTLSRPKLACDICGSAYGSRARLRAHVSRTHLGLKYNKHVVCELCGKQCTSNATLRYHQRTHTGERPFPCAECGKRFPDRNQLRIHARTHSGARPYACAACPKTFRQKPALNRHMRVHTGAKPYECQFCSKAFSQSNSLKGHVRTVHLKLPANNRRNKTQIPLVNPTVTEKMASEAVVLQSL